MRRAAAGRSLAAQRCDIATKAAKSKLSQTDETRRFAIDAARLAGDTRCQNVVVLDVRGLCQVTDYFVLATGTSAKQMRSVAEEIEELGTPRKFTAISRSGYEAANWMLIDFVDVIVQVFSPSARSYYDLDGLWGDAPKVEWDKS
jgi:ribosome-associated protein